MATVIESLEGQLDQEATELNIDTPNQTDDDEGIPERFKGKDRKTIADAFVNLERELGRKSNEVGELRKLADDFLREKLEKKPVEPEIDDTDFFSNPKETVNKVVQNHPAVRQANQELAEMKRFKALAALGQAHPDYLDVAKDPEFANWVGKSKIRSELAQRADRHFDADAAIELFDVWKDLKKSQKTEEVKRAELDRRKEELGKAGVSGGSPGEISKKVFKRADLIRLRMTDPDKYSALQDEIYRAYQEGRVK